MTRIWEALQHFAITYGPNVLAAAATLLFGWLGARLLTGVLRRLMARGRTDPTLTGFVTHFAYLALMTLVVISVLTKLGVQTTSFITIIGAVGVAVGFALQGSLANFAAGVMLIAFRPFRVGDMIEAGGAGGTVAEIQVFATTLTTDDNKVVIVPNAAITSGNITNLSARGTRRIELVFGIGYGDDLRKAKGILEQILARDSRILKDPAPVIAVCDLADSSVKIVARPWVKSTDYWAVRWDMTEAVKLEFDAQGISIPFPQQDVYLHRVA